MRSRATAAIVGLAICLPCLIPVLLAVGIGAGAFSAAGAWFSGNGLMLGAAAAAAVAFATLAGIIYTRRARAAACDTS
jgi:hypothetical protein